MNRLEEGHYLFALFFLKTFLSNGGTKHKVNKYFITLFFLDKCKKTIKNLITSSFGTSQAFDTVSRSNAQTKPQNLLYRKEQEQGHKSAMRSKVQIFPKISFVNIG